LSEIRRAMKICAYCGHKNEDAAIVCSECGSSEFESVERAPSARAEATESEALQVVKVFSNAQAADIAAATLRASGIDCTIAADDAGGMLLNFQTSEGVRVLVPSSRLEEARELLEGGAGGVVGDQASS